MKRNPVSVCSLDQELLSVWSMMGPELSCVAVTVEQMRSRPSWCFDTSSSCEGVEPTLTSGWVWMGPELGRRTAYKDGQWGRH